MNAGFDNILKKSLLLILPITYEDKMKRSSLKIQRTPLLYPQATFSRTHFFPIWIGFGH